MPDLHGRPDSDARPDLDRRLLRCFASVFADLSNEEIRSASTDSLSAWDSLASVTLIAVLQEEFGFQVALADYPKLKSFEGVATYIRSRNGTDPTKTHSAAASKESQ